MSFVTLLKTPINEGDPSSFKGERTIYSIKNVATTLAHPVLLAVLNQGIKKKEHFHSSDTVTGLNSHKYMHDQTPAILASDDMMD